jgi:hypothetical protein
LRAGDDDDDDRRMVYRSATHGNSTGACPWDPWRAWLLALYPPLPSGTSNEVWLPNDAKPGLELSLTVAGEDDKYAFNVPPGGFGGRKVRGVDRGRRCNRVLVAERVAWREGGQACLGCTRTAHLSPSPLASCCEMNPCVGLFSAPLLSLVRLFVWLLSR